MASPVSENDAIQFVVGRAPARSEPIDVAASRFKHKCNSSSLEFGQEDGPHV